MVVLVCGSRDWPDPGAIERRLSGLPGEHEEITILHGDAPGADRTAARAAAYYGFGVRAFPADWKRHGRAAGFIRNVLMLMEQPDLVIAFQHDGSSGTQHTIEQARRRGIPVEVHTA